MTRKSKREVERGINDLRDRDRDPDGPGIIIGYEREDGTLTDRDGDPIPENDLDRARLVIRYPRQ